VAVALVEVHHLEVRREQALQLRLIIEDCDCEVERVFFGVLLIFEVEVAVEVGAFQVDLGAHMLLHDRERRQQLLPLHIPLVDRLHRRRQKELIHMRTHREYVIGVGEDVDDAFVLGAPLGDLLGALLEEDVLGVLRGSPDLDRIREKLVLIPAHYLFHFGVEDGDCGELFDEDGGLDHHVPRVWGHKDKAVRSQDRQLIKLFQRDLPDA